MSKGRIAWSLFSVAFASLVGYLVTGLSSPTAIPNYSMATTAIPGLSIPHYQTSGEFPIATKANFDATQLNRGLVDDLLAAERAYSSNARHDLVLPNSGSTTVYDGGYTVWLDTRLISVGPRLVSGLLPVTDNVPGGGGLNRWLAFSVEVPSGRNVNLLTSIFRAPSSALRFVASVATNQMTSQCGAQFASFEFNATRANYEDMALTPDGLAIGFVPAGCEFETAVIPYRQLVAYLNPYGKQLTSAASKPRFDKLAKTYTDPPLLDP